MKNYIRYYLCVFMIALASGAFAQSAGDKLFIEGQKLQQIGTITSQKQAINKFKAAKVVYTSANKKKMCDNQIEICLKRMNTTTQRTTRTREKKNKETKTTKLRLSHNRIEFDGDKEGMYDIFVTAPTTEWVFNLVAGIEGEQSFAKANRSDDAKSIEISVEANPSTLERHQSMKVTYGDDTQDVTIIQQGKPVTLSTNTNLVEFKLKGGNKTIELYTNSDSIISSNNDLTWYVLSKPQWIETSVEVAKNSSTISKGLKALKELVTSTTAAATAKDVKTSSVRIVAQPILKGSMEAQTGRKGEIVFASQDKTYKINIIQQK